MKKQTLGEMIATLRKEQGLTQAALAEKMNVTDKAVSKWERDLSCPDINSLPKLAEVLQVSVDELMQVKACSQEEPVNIKEIITTIFKAVTVASGIAVVVLSFMDQIDTNSAIPLLAIGVTCAGISLLQKKD